MSPEEERMQQLEELAKDQTRLLQKAYCVLMETYDVADMPQGLDTAAGQMAQEIESFLNPTEISP